MSNSESVIVYLKDVVSKAEEAADYVRRFTEANLQEERVCVRCEKSFSRLHFLPECPQINWIEIHEKADGEVCQACDSGIPCSYIGSETFCVSSTADTETM